MQLQDDHLQQNLTDAESAQSMAATAAPRDLERMLVSAHELSLGGDLETANEMYSEALTRIEALPADQGQPHLAEVLWNLANNMYVLNQVDECIPYFNRLVAVQEEKLGPEDGTLITPLLRLAIALKRAGQADESESVFERSMALAKKVNPDGQLPAATATTSSKSDSAFIHPAQENISAVEPQGAEQTKAAPQSDVDHEMLKHLFSDNSPLHAAEQTPQQPQQDDTSQHIPVLDSPAFVDRNPEATRLSDLDLAALGAIPSPAAMKTMFREAPPPDPNARTKAAAFLKANENTDEPVKFAETVKNFDAGEAAPFMVRNKWLLPTVAIVLVLFVVGYLVRDHLDHTTSVDSWDQAITPNALSAVKTYATFDKHSSLSVISGDKAVYQTGGKSYRAKCFFLDGDPRDFVSVIPGSYSGRHLWFEEDAGGLKQEDGGTLYLPDAPMSQVVSQMAIVAERAQEYFKINHTYPTSAEQFQAALGTAASHINPITHKGDSPKFYATYASNLTTSTVKLEEKTAAGESWINETTMAPGEIHCCSLIYEDPAGRAANALAGANPAALTAGMSSHFFIRASDIDAKFIPGSKPGTTFFIELSDGTSTGLDTIKSVTESPRDFSRLRILVAKSFAEQSFFMFVAGAVPAILVMIMAGCWVIQTGLHDQKDQEAADRKALVKRLLIGCSALLALWILVCALG